MNFHRTLYLFFLFHILMLLLTIIIWKSPCQHLFFLNNYCGTSFLYIIFHSVLFNSCNSLKFLQPYIIIYNLILRHCIGSLFNTASPLKYCLFYLKIYLYQNPIICTLSSSIILLIKYSTMAQISAFQFYLYT